jgi:carboxyl-terminal processing protease
MLRSVLSLIFILFHVAALAQSPVSAQQEALQLKKKILEHHVSPKPVNDLFSETVFDYFFESLDPDKLYFTQQEINDLAVYKTKIDDELAGTSWKFLDAVAEKFKQALTRTQHTINKHTGKSFSFTDNEIYHTDTTWAWDETALSQRWYLHLKFETLDELLSLSRSNSNVSDNQFLVSKENGARQRAKKRSERSIKRIIGHPSGYENHIASLFLRSISLAFDPHSTHFSFTEMQNYVNSLSTEGFYFGISLDENEHGDIIISELTPGGPAWKSGAVHSGDVIEQVRWVGTEWIDVVGMSLEEMNEILMESNKDVMEFSLMQTGGIQKKVSLRKEKMEAEENVVKSFILQGEKRIGYISLPGFYSSLGGNESSHSANDVAKEILKLKKENIDGLVLDVRYNRGGSLYEAVAMAGIFIDAGPMGILKDKTGTVTSVKDMNRGTVYDGPLVLMVNGLSASASEFLAAALQDYNRGVIVGSRTYGKATGQVIVPMQPGKTEVDQTLDMKSGWGFSTITTMKIYRITGKTAQKNGVTPDIVLPDFYDFIEFREAFAPGALSSDSIYKKTYYTPFKTLPLKQLAEKSRHRMSGSEAFKLTAACSRQIVDLKQRLDSVSLNWVDYKTLMETEASKFKLLSDVTSKPTTAYEVNNHAFDKQRMQMDEYSRQINEGWIKNLLHDITLEEAFYIICDYIAATSPN